MPGSGHGDRASEDWITEPQKPNRRLTPAGRMVVVWAAAAMAALAAAGLIFSHSQYGY